MFDAMSPEELELANVRDDQARKLIEAASIQLMRYRPFYGTMLAHMPIINAVDWLSTAATDGRNIYYSPEFIAGMTDERKALVFSRIEQMFKGDGAKIKKMKDHITNFYRPKTAREVCFILQHEVRHVVADHASRGKGFEPNTYNIAADHYINCDLIVVHSGPSNIGPAWFPKGSKTVFVPEEEWGFMASCYADFRFYGKTTEEIYDILMQEGAAKNPGLMGGDSHTDANGKMGGNSKRASDEHGDGEPSNGDVDDALGVDNNKQPKCSQQRKNANDSAMRHAIENAVKAAGSGAPPEARRFVDEAGAPKINYLRLIRKTVERLMKVSVSYRRPARRSFGLTRVLRKGGYITQRQSVILPGPVKGKTINCHIFFDVSGSFTDDLLGPTKREIRGLCSLYEDFRVTLACWSTKVGNIAVFDKDNVGLIKDYKISTTGGTDVACVFNKLDELKEDIDQVIIYTDGCFSDVSKTKDWAKKYGNKTLWVILGKGAAGEWVPPFGKAVMFDKYL